MEGIDMEEKVIFKIKNEDGTEEDWLVCHREDVTIESILGICRQVGCIE